MIKIIISFLIFMLLNNCGDCFAIAIDPDEIMECSDHIGGTYNINDNPDLDLYLLIWFGQDKGPWKVRLADKFSDGTWRTKKVFISDSRTCSNCAESYCQLCAILTESPLDDDQTFSKLSEINYSAKSECITVEIQQSIH